MVVVGVTERSLGDPKDYHKQPTFVSLEPQWLNCTNQPSDINLFIDLRSKIIQSSS